VSKSKWAQFTTNLPDDQIEEGNRIIRFGGLNVAEAIAASVRGMGFVVEGPLEAGLNGWELYPIKDKLKVWIQISGLGDFFLLGVSELKTFRSARRRQWFVQEFTVPFNEALRRNSALVDIAWVDPGQAPDGPRAYSPDEPSVPER
jgi:hypothetical protein